MLEDLKRFFTDKKNIAKITCFVWLLTICYGLYNWILDKKKDYKYEVSTCFMLETQVHPEPKEYWHPPELIKPIEYIVLKIGQKNYQTSNELGIIQDLTFNLTRSSTPSDCSKIFNKEKTSNN